MKWLKRIVIGFIAFFVLVAGGLLAANFYLFDVQEVRFQSSGVELAGTLVIPRGISTVAAIAFVPGSGASERNVTLGKIFALNGIATLVYDKRGVGTSGGVFDSDNNASGDYMRTQATDASSALSHLSNHSKLSSVPAGLVGVSAAGWVIPLAAMSNSNVEFIGLYSGCVCAVSEEDIFSEFTGDEESLDEIPSFEEIQQSLVNQYSWPEDRGEDIDSAQILAGLDIPGFWIFGAVDGVMPIDLSVANLDILIRDEKNYTYEILENTGHSNVDPTTVGLMANWIKSIAE